MKNSNKKGFTLVELVVVIAIIGVLAAILVPSMMGYVKKSRLKTANGNAKTIYNAVVTFATDQEVQGLYNPASLTATNANLSGQTPGDSTVLGACAKAIGGNGGGAGFVSINPPTGTDTESMEGLSVLWHKTSSDPIYGRYPNPFEKVSDSTNAFS